jgi:hypothetical protein
VPEAIEQPQCIGIYSWLIVNFNYKKPCNVKFTTKVRVVGMLIQSGFQQILNIVNHCNIKET